MPGYVATSDALSSYCVNEYVLECKLWASAGLAVVMGVLTCGRLKVNEAPTLLFGKSRH